MQVTFVATSVQFPCPLGLPLLCSVILTELQGQLLCPLIKIIFLENIYGVNNLILSQGECLSLFYFSIIFSFSGKTKCLLDSKKQNDVYFKLCIFVIYVCSIL